MNKTVEEIIASGDVMQIEHAIRQYESEQLYDFDLFSYKVSLCMLKGENEKAYEYAKAHLDEMPEKDKQLFVEFFFSGNWVKED